MDGLFIFVSSLAENSLKAAVITSISFALKNTRYLGGSTDLSFLRAKSILYLLATRSKDLIFRLVISMLVRPCLWFISFPTVCFPRGTLFSAFFATFFTLCFSWFWRYFRIASFNTELVTRTGTVEYIDPLHRYIRIDDTEIILISITEIEALWWDFL